MATISEVYINAFLADATYAIDESYSAPNFKLESTLFARDEFRSALIMAQV